MPQPRRTAWALIATLVATLAYASPTAVLGAVPTPTLCPDGMPTQWTDDVHPPTTVRVLRNMGPLKGKVETVGLWKYVGTVLRAEYSTGGSKPYPWMHVGALTIKQYAWYYAKMWRGGKVTYSVDPSDPEADTKTECYDLKDSTADQIYHPEKPDPNNPGQWIPANIPTGVNLQAMRQTWHMSLRKWMPDKNFSRLFLTGYRSGMKKPCGTDSTGFKVYQKSLRDCGNKNLTLEETLRRYFEANMLSVNSRSNDFVDDAEDWRGDLGMLSAGSGGSTDARIYKGTTDSFVNSAVINFAGVTFASIIGQGVGNVDGPDTNPDPTRKDPTGRQFADLLMLVNTGGSNRQLLVAKSLGNGFMAPSGTAAPDGADRLLVGDFNGDLLTDAGFMVTNGGTRKLMVVLSLVAGGFGAATQWWSAPEDSAVDAEFVGDVNGDGKADLVMHTTGHSYLAATSRKSCTDYGAYGPCPAGAIGAPGLDAANVWLATGWTAPAGDVQSVMGDYDRDGRDDVLAVVKNGSAIKVHGLRSIKDAGAFAAPHELWSGLNGIAFSDIKPSALNVNPDGMTDLALAYNNGGMKLMWLKSIEKSAAPATMTATTLFDAGSWSSSLRSF